MNDCNGETKQEKSLFEKSNREVLFKGNKAEVFAPQSEQASKVQKCHIVNDYSGENAEKVDVIES